jgi:alkylation response protein AidB-like acyl-CoA dehydrogenase
MNFDLTDEQRLLVDTVASFAKKNSPLHRFRALRDDPLGWSRDIWRQMGELGLLGVSLPESVGGSGGSFVDAALVLEQLAVTLVPEPWLTSLVAAAPILALGTEAQQQQFVAPFVAGDVSLALAWAEPQGRYDVGHVATRAEKHEGGYRLLGKKVWVLDGHAASFLVVSARVHGAAHERDGIALFVVDRETPGVSIQSVKTMDGRHAAVVTLAGAFVPTDRLLGAEGGAYEALVAAMDLGAAGACAEGAGIARAALQMTTEYLRTREQFGVKIGSFQALQHRAVDMFVEAEVCKSMAILAAIRATDADPKERAAAVSAAKVQLSIGGRYVTQQSIQLHGGIGVTDEHDIGLYFKRMHALNVLFGDEEHHVERFSNLPSFTEGLSA